MTTMTNIDASDLVDVTNRLKEILQQEVLMIKSMQIAKLHTLQDEKIKLTSVLEEYKEILKNNPQIIKELPKSTIEEMKQAAVGFESLVAEDELQIKKARKVHSIIMNAVKKAVLKKTTASSGYNKNGEVDYGKKKMFQSQPISINESI